ncbi:hypothetical protein ACFX5E_14495 [Flavobacterium sp. LS2P90]|uniref:O-antigen ligase domain-containing protein n=1 Tax=Flavobacterium xylosi TaxID=3230415 RepID=A0ABW6HZ26_9FLAO
MKKIKLQQRYLPFSILLVSIYSILPSIEYKAGSQIFNPAVSWILQIFILFAFYKGKEYFVNQSQTSLLLIVKLYLFWNVLSILRGFFVAETYWDWKGLTVNGLALTTPIVVYVATNESLLQFILRFYVKYTLPLFIFFYFLISTDAYGFYLVPISFLALFLPVIKTPWKWIVFSICLFVIFVDFGARSNVIKFGLPIGLSFIYYFRFILSNKFFEFIRKMLFVAPLILFLLAVNGIFNVFNMDEYIKGNYVEKKRDERGQMIEDKLTADTRTFLYVEVLKTAVEYDSWLIGRSPARGNKSEWFGEEDMNKRGERLTNEVAILNVFTWTGIVGVLLYFLIFYRASNIAINQSNNIFSKILGLFVAFRWLYAWVEDVNIFNLTTFFLWIMIGLCFSKSFRYMSDKEVAFWVRGIFEKKNANKKRIITKII